MTRCSFTKAHAYGNDFLYVRHDAVVDHRPDRMTALARELCDRHTGIGADGLMLYTPTADGASMRLLNADGSPSEVSGNGVRGLAAILVRENPERDTRNRHPHRSGREAIAPHRSPSTPVRHSWLRWGCRTISARSP